MGASVGFGWRWQSFFLATVIAFALPSLAVAQPAEPERAVEPEKADQPAKPATPEPGALDEALPSETPPPPELTAEPPPAAPVLIQQLPLVSPAAPVFDARSDPAGLDVMLPASLSSLGVGVVLALSGGITLAASGAPAEYCGPTGCIDRVDRHAENIGADLIGAGAGFALVGGAGLIEWATARPRRSERRRSTPLLATGFTMTAFSAAGLGLGIAQTATYAGNEADFSTSWPLFLSSGLLAAGGIPLLAVGATNWDDRERAEVAENERRQADPTLPKKRRSTGMVVAGAILTGIGGLGALAGTGALIADSALGGGGILTTIVALPCFGASVLFSSVGIPLVVVGNRRVVDDSRVADEGLPAVHLGPSGLEASWRLQ